MRWPSAYCATSSGTAMVMSLVYTQPASPSGIRIRLQRSVGTGFSLRPSSEGFCDWEFDLDISSQSGGGPGGLGSGGGGINLGFLGAFFESAFFFGGGGGTSGARATSCRGRMAYCRTSNLSLDLMVRKLGAV